MAGGSASASVLNQLATISQFGAVGNLSDSQLVQRFLTGRDGAQQAAFEALMERHGPMVLRICRQIVCNLDDAEDAFQATFLVLARKAGSMRKTESLASWLHGIALRVALRAKRNEAQRRLHERRCATMREKELECDAVRPGPCPELHEEISRLPQRYREPVVLCYLEGLTSEQAAVRIGCPPGTVWSRLSRGRERLRKSLVRRGAVSPMAFLAAGSRLHSPAALPVRLIHATARASLGFAARLATEAPVASTPAITLAMGVLYAMSISKLRIIGLAVFASALALGGAHTLTLGQTGGLEGKQAPDESVPRDDDTYAPLKGAVDKLESDLLETARRNTEMRRDVRNIRAMLEPLSDGRRQGAASKDARRFSEVLKPQPAQAVARLVEQLKRYPVLPKAAPDRLGIYMMDVSNGEVTLISDQPAPGLGHCGSPVWSHDGRRILFDATPESKWNLTRLVSIDLAEGRPTVTDLGTGNCPSFSPADDRIAFLSNANDVQSGVWVMKANGSERRLLGVYGKPVWSPDGRQIMIIGVEDGLQVRMMSANPDKSSVLKLSDHKIFPNPSWAGENTIVAVIGRTEGDTVALIDVSDPLQAKVKEILWRRANARDVKPTCPIYSSSTRRCIFVAEARAAFVLPRQRPLEEVRYMALYTVQQSDAGPGKLLGSQGYDSYIVDPAFSPDGRYVLFAARGVGPAYGALAP